MNWCLITNKDLKGWISKKLVWAVNENEVYNILFYRPVINKSLLENFRYLILTKK